MGFQQSNDGQKGGRMDEWTDGWMGEGGIDGMRVLLFLIHHCMYITLFVGVLFWSLMRKRELVALLYSSF